MMPPIRVLEIGCCFRRGVGVLACGLQRLRRLDPLADEQHERRDLTFERVVEQVRRLDHIKHEPGRRLGRVAALLCRTGLIAERST
jgi:hypothetical protein